MRVTLISIGDELLIGQTVNTNASWLGKELSLLGARIQEVLTISDDADHIRRAIEVTEADLILVTGGLGPTKDDRTKKVLAKYFEMPLVLHEPTLKHIEDFFARRNRPMLQAKFYPTDGERRRECGFKPRENPSSAFRGCLMK
jgi:nicotinamide-nucleotide amidase